MDPYYLAQGRRHQWKRQFTMSDNASEAVSSAIREVVDANHILFDQGVVDGFGHVSLRHPVRPDHFLLARSMAPELVTAQDVLVFDRDGAPIGISILGAGAMQSG
jgi:ribulose-5-phosphate 4-epimerase/fuculose-1-phosphate aldolase